MEKVIEKKVKTAKCGCGGAEVPKKGREKKWEKPTLEDVSEKVMAQPYIRFT